MRRREAVEQISHGKRQREKIVLLQAVWQWRICRAQSIRDRSLAEVHREKLAQKIRNYNHYKSKINMLERNYRDSAASASEFSGRAGTIPGSRAGASKDASSMSDSACEAGNPYLQSAVQLATLCCQH